MLYNELVIRKGVQMREFFSSESVTKGHPDKVCDQISDAVLDAILALDKNARVACETVCTTDFLLVMGEITTTAKVDIEKIARDTISSIGYTEKEIGFDADTVEILVKIKEQSADIALGVDNSLEKKEGGDIYDQHGAGDQGMMFGFATNETKEYMPLAHALANKMCKKVDEVRESGLLPYLRPDGKGQITVEYFNGKPVRIDTVVLSCQHDKSVSTEKLREDLIELVIKKVLPKEYLDENTKYLVNPTGRFEIGGPNGDSGLTGRKIIVDTYGGYCAHGGGAFSGKDPTKVDRSASYMARYVAKNIVASGMASKCMIEVAYAIGVAKPVSIFVNTYGTSKLTDEEVANIIWKEFDLRPSAIIETLSLRNPIYSDTASYGHFGKENYPWERLDRVEDLKKYLWNFSIS